MKNNKIIIIVGEGGLPRILVNELIYRSEVFILIIIKGTLKNSSLLKYPHIFVTYGNIITSLKELRKNGYKRILFAGSLKRPLLKNINPDMNMIKLLPKISKIFIKGGDDRLLSFIMDYLESLGFLILDIRKFLENYFPKSGTINRIKVSKISKNDIIIGKKILDHMSPLDIGQSIIVQEGNVLGIEAIEGTDNLIKRTRKYIKDGQKPTLIKLIKKGQDLRADLPTIGLQTIKLCCFNFIGGIAYSANTTLFIDYKKVIEKTNLKNIFLYGIN